MPRYIDADKLIKKIFPVGLVDGGKYTINAKAVKCAIDCIPTADVVEVVRCKDCVHSKPIDTIVSCRHYKPECISCSCEEVAGDGAMVYFPNHYCSYGEKKKEAEI